MIVADASWVIALRDPADTHHAAAAAINESIGSEQVLLHDVTLAECLVAPARLGVIDEALASLGAAFEIVHADDDAPIRWAKLRAVGGLRLPDTVVLDTAIVSGAMRLVSFDEQLLDRAPRHGVEVLAAPA